MSDESGRLGRPPKQHTDGTPEWARRLRAAREDARLSIGQLADAVGLNRDAVARYDAGERVPNALAGVRIARTLSTTAEDLFG